MKLSYDEIIGPRFSARTGLPYDKVKHALEIQGWESGIRNPQTVGEIEDTATILGYSQQWVQHQIDALSQPSPEVTN